MITTIFHSNAFKGALTGLISAALVDFHSFLSWKKWQDVKQYDWSTATFRWLIGTVSGALTGAGYGGLVG